METGPVKPFCPVTDMVNVEAAPPACCVTLFGETAIAKSCVADCGDWLELPQPVSKAAPRQRKLARCAAKLIRRNLRADKCCDMRVEYYGEDFVASDNVRHTGG